MGREKMKKFWMYGISNFDVITQTVKQWPDPGGLVVVDRTEFMLGGTAINTAVTLRKLGYPEVGLIARLGDDLVGRIITSELERLSVDISSLSIASGRNTAVCIVCVHPGGERSFLYSFGENNALGSDNADISRVSSSDFFHLGASMGMARSRADLLNPLLMKLKEQGVFITSDTSFDPQGIWWESLAPSLPFVDVIFSNESEAKALTGLADPEKAAAFFQAAGAKVAVIKLGADGSFVLSDTWAGFTQPFPVKVVDTTGAGDSFCGGFLYGIAMGWSKEQCALFANAVGALCVGSFGATTGIKPFQETVDFLRQTGRAGEWSW
jgi:sugar/nucleoside kinase (ribokinase family)